MPLRGVGEIDFAVLVIYAVSSIKPMLAVSHIKNTIKLQLANNIILNALCCVSTRTILTQMAYEIFFLQ